MIKETEPFMKPCPCCGEYPEFCDGESAFIICTECRLQTEYGRRDDVIAAWNKRTPDTLAHSALDGIPFDQEQHEVNRSMKYIGPFAGMGDMTLRDAFALAATASGKSINTAYAIADEAMEVRKQ